MYGRIKHNLVCYHAFKCAESFNKLSLSSGISRGLYQICNLYDSKVCARSILLIPLYLMAHFMNIYNHEVMNTSTVPFISTSIDQYIILNPHEGNNNNYFVAKVTLTLLFPRPSVSGNSIYSEGKYGHYFANKEHSIREDVILLHLL